MERWPPEPKLRVSTTAERKKTDLSLNKVTAKRRGNFVAVVHSGVFTRLDLGISQFDRCGRCHPCRGERGSKKPRRMNQLLLGRQSISDIKQSDQNRFQDPFQSETLPAGGERECRLLDLSHSAKERQCEAPVPGHDGNRRHHQWRLFSSHAPARRPEKPLAQSGPEVARSCGHRHRRGCHPRNRAGGRGTGARGADRSEKSSRRHPEGAGIMVGHHAHRAPRLDPVDHLRQASGDAGPPDQKRLLDARGREATRLLLRPLRILQ
jgi:hypothetical protein